MPGEGRSFRRNHSKFWEIWPMPPKIEEHKSVVFVDGIYLARNICVLICCDERNVLGWYVCKYERAEAWEALMRRIAEPIMVVSDGGTGFKKALRKVWSSAKIQRCTFHAFCQVKRYTTTKPKTAAGRALYALASDLLHISKIDEAVEWTVYLNNWRIEYKEFLSEMTRDKFGNLRPTHERLIKAENSLTRLVKEKTLFTYLDENLRYVGKLPSTNNRIEGGINSRIRAMLWCHRGLSTLRRIKAVFWFCYFESPHQLTTAEILKAMPTDASIANLYREMNNRSQLEKSIPTWGDTIVWSDLHRYDRFFNNPWD